MFSCVSAIASKTKKGLQNMTGKWMKKKVRYNKSSLRLKIEAGILIDPSSDMRRNKSSEM